MKMTISIFVQKESGDELFKEGFLTPGEALSYIKEKGEPGMKYYLTNIYEL